MSDAKPDFEFKEDFKSETSNAEDCCQHCRDEYHKCIEYYSGNPTAQARCEKFKKRCEANCNS